MSPRSISSGPDVRATVFWRPCYRSNPAALKDNCRAARPENFARRQNLRREGLIRARPVVVQPGNIHSIFTLLTPIDPCRPLFTSSDLLY